MAKTDQELLNSALIDLTETEKKRLRSLLTSRVQTLRTKKVVKPKDFVTTGTGVQPNIKVEQDKVVIPSGRSNQEQIDELQRKINEVDKSLKTKESKTTVSLPAEDSRDRAKGGAQYALQNENEAAGLVEYTRPGEEEVFTTGYLVLETKELKSDPRTYNVTNVVNQEQWNQNIYNKYSQDSEATIEMKRKLVELGLLPRGTVIDGVPDTAFRTAMNTLGARISTENFRRIQADPRGQLFDLRQGLDYLISRGDADGGTARKTTTTISTKDEAYGTLNQALTAYLGREATQEELSQFTAQLNAFERKSPEVQTTTGTDTVVTGGAAGARERMATEFARSQEGSAAFRGGTYYYDALLDALDNPLF
jgi:hypothetical protein